MQWQQLNSGWMADTVVHLAGCEGASTQFSARCKNQQCFWNLAKRYNSAVAVAANSLLAYLPLEPASSGQRLQ